MRRVLSLWLFLSLLLTAKADPIADLLGRVLPHRGDAQKFVWVKTDTPRQQFTIACDGRKVTVSGSDYIAIATGINWYLQHYAGIDIAWNCPTARLPKRLPVCAAETHTASVPLRYYLNFCTFSYSMAFWDWERWQQELDWMALHGVNMPLAITGMECVWREVLQHDYGYTLDEVNTFVSGSAYYGWFFMNNLTGWGGPQPEQWYTQQQALARNIFRRMQEFGMSPVVPGYVGMIPKDFLTQADASSVAGWTASDIVDGGIWCAFTRPAFVNNTNRLKEFATRYYAAFKRLYGDVCTPHFYAIDPFHEGGVPRGVTDAKASVAAMWEALQAFDPDAVWVAQHWQNNPTTIVTHTIPRGRLVILDLHGDQYADTECSGHHTSEDGASHDWVWGQVSNFGGNVGMFGRMDRLIACFYEARRNKGANGLVGIGALPEGIENNPMLYDLLFALPWTTTDYTRDAWLSDYVRMRYGLTPADKAYSAMLSAWKRLGAGIYNCPNDHQQGTTESVFLMRPSLTAGTVSTWANSSWYWDAADLRTALQEMLSVSRCLKKNQNYRYDLVDVTRQCLADYGKALLDSICAAPPAASSASSAFSPSGAPLSASSPSASSLSASSSSASAFSASSSSASSPSASSSSASAFSPSSSSPLPFPSPRFAAGGSPAGPSSLTALFLQLILDQDRLLGTRPEFRLGRWTGAARALGRSAAESNLYEQNARMLLTTWGDRAQCERGQLHDYANREWQGLLSTFYYPRWKAFFDNGCTARNWFDNFEWPFVQGASCPYGTFSTQPEGDEIAIATELFQKYLR